MKVNNKFKLIDVEQSILKQLVALRDIKTSLGTVLKGDLGGYVTDETNLSDLDECWIFPGGMVTGGAKVKDAAVVHGRAHVFGNAVIFENAIIKGQDVSAKFNHMINIHGRALIYGNSLVTKSVTIAGYARVLDNATITDDARLYGNALVSGRSLISGSAVMTGHSKAVEEAKISGFAVIKGNATVACEVTNRCELLVIGPIGSREDFVTCVRGIHYTTGCFIGTREEFIAAVCEMHEFKNKEHFDNYISLVKFFDDYFGLGHKSIL